MVARLRKSMVSLVYRFRLELLRFLRIRFDRAMPSWRWPWPLRRPWQKQRLSLVSFGGGIGDELMCTPVFRAIRRSNPNVHLTFYSRQPELFRDHPALDAVEPVKNGEPVLAFPLTYGPVYRKEGIFPPEHPLIPLLGDCVGLEVNDSMLDGPKLVPAESTREQFERMPAPRIVIQPLASRWTPNKNWPEPNWRELVDRLLRDYSVVEIGADAMWPGQDFGPRFLSLAGKTSVSDFAWLISQASVFVGPISSGLHLARAYNVPSVIIFGGWEKPEGHQYPQTHAFYTDVPCAPCWLCEPCPYDLKCLRAITPDAVHAAVVRQFGSFSHARS